MKTNSLALRLFITAAAWVLVVLPVAGWIIFARYRHEVVTAHRARFLPGCTDEVDSPVPVRSLLALRALSLVVLPALPTEAGR